MRHRSEAPRVAWGYGLLGLIPFAVAGVVVATADAKRGEGQRKAAAERGLIVYAALIASFLGGARWGLEIPRRPVRTSVISASMAPTVASFLLALLPRSRAATALAGLMGVFAAQWAWDTRSTDTPAWYPGLRTVLTCGALIALLTGVVAS